MDIEQPQAESMADRIANQFDQPTEETEQQPEAPTEETVEQETAPEAVEVEFEGKSYQVPPELKEALMKQSDYTKKTTEVAEKARLVEIQNQQIKAHEAERKFHASVKDDITAMQKIDFQIEQYKSIDATGLTSDQMWNLSRQIDALKESRAELQNKVSEKHGAYQQEQQRLSQETFAKAQEAAMKAVPNWSEATQKQIREFATSQGFAAEELNNVTDPRVVKVLWQASQFAKLQAQQVKGKVTTTPAVKPGSSNPMPQNVKDTFQFNKAMKSAPNSSAKAKLIEKELMRRF